MAYTDLRFEKSTNDRFISRFGDFGFSHLSALLKPWSAAERGAHLYLVPERRASPPALPEPAGGMVLAVPGFQPHLNARLWGADRPDAPLVLLAHDWEGQIQDLMALVTALLARGVRVVAFDAPAHGRSAGDEAHVLSMARAVAAVAQAAGGQVTAAIGHGLGAAALVLAMEQGFRPGRAALLAPLVDIALPVRQIAHVLRLGETEEQRMLELIDRVLGCPLHGISLAAPAAPPPALLVHSADDRVAPVADALHLAALWPGMRQQLVNGLGHRRLLADAAVLDLVADFAIIDRRQALR